MGSVLNTPGGSRETPWTIVIKGIRDGGRAGHVAFQTDRVTLEKGGNTTVTELRQALVAASLPPFGLSPFTEDDVGPLYPATEEEKSYPRSTLQGSLDHVSITATLTEAGLVDGCCLWWYKPLPPGVYD